MNLEEKMRIINKLKFFTFVDSDIVLENLDKKTLDDFKYLIKNLNDILKSMYGCQIRYDYENINDKINLNGFAIIGKEYEETK